MLKKLDFSKGGWLLIAIALLVIGLLAGAIVFVLSVMSVEKVGAPVGIIGIVVAFVLVILGFIASMYAFSASVKKWDWTLRMQRLFGYAPPMPGQPNPGQPYNGPYPGQPGQPYAGQPYAGQPWPAQPYPPGPQPSPRQGPQPPTSLNQGI